MIILTNRGNLLRNFTLEYPLSRKKGEPPISEAERIERLINLTNDIVGLVKTYKVRHVAIEGYAHDKRYQAHQIGEIGGNVKVQLWLARKIVAEVVPPLTGRKHLFGYGKAKKEQCFEILTERLNLMLDNMHEADAYVVANYLWHIVARREKGTM